MVESLSDSIRYCSSHGSLAVQQIWGRQHEPAVGDTDWPLSTRRLMAWLLPDLWRLPEGVLLAM